MNSNLLLETIRCEGGVTHHLAYHQKRLEDSLHILGHDITYPLHELISPPDNRLYRCRFLYDHESYRIEYHPYSPKSISSLKIVHSDLSYPLKYSDRTELNNLYSLRDQCDDILIVKNDYLTDTSVANIALLIDGEWLTPDTPLLPGTTRARLIEEKRLQPAPLHLSDISKASKIAIMNAMIGFVELENGIIS